jgi:putative Holliday junction resolvase
VLDSVFEDNDCGLGGGDAGNDGGAIASNASLGVIQGNLFDGNTAGDASDLIITGSTGPISVVQNSFLDGASFDSSSSGSSELLGGAVVIGSNHVLLANNLFGGHSAAEGSSGLFVAWASSFTEVYNNLFIYGTTPDGGAIQFSPGVQSFFPAIVANNIVVNNAGWGVYSGYAGQPAGLSNNDVWNNSLGLYTSTAIVQPPPLLSLSVDPLFGSASDDGDWSNDDFTLSSGSLCIEAGRFSLVWVNDDASGSMTRAMGLDVGRKTIGVAVSDPLGIFAQPVETIARKGTKKDLARVAEIVSAREVDTIVVGLPVRTDGSEGESAKLARGVAERIPELVEGVRVVLQDERFTTKQAERVLIEGRVRRKKRKAVIDQMAAVLILQGYLDSASRGG